MLKSLRNDVVRQKEGKAKFAKSAQESIPVKQITQDGIFKCGKLYSQMYEFSDINYAVASPEEQKEMFLKYRQLLNGLPADCVTKITIMNSEQREGDIRHDILLPERSDGLNHFRSEYNAMIAEKSRYGNGITQKRYITISSERRDESEARAFFSRASAELAGSLRTLGASMREIKLPERLGIIGGFFNKDSPAFLKDIKSITARGHDFRDTIAPARIKFNTDHIEMDGRFCRVLFLRGYPTYLKDMLLNDLSASVSVPLSLSVDILPIPTDEAIKEVQSKLLGVDSDRARFQKRQNRANNFSAIMPYSLQSAYDDTREILEDLTTRDQRLLFGLVTLAHVADSKEQLDADTENFISIGNKYLCTFAALKYQQEDALNTALPYGIRPIETTRSLTSESAAAFMPFNAQEMIMPGGVYYGVHAVTNNLVVCDRMAGLNANGFVLGSTGSGKSFITKEELVFILLSRPNDNIMIIDPQGEYSELVKSLGGTVIYVASGGKSYINAFDMADYADADTNPIAIKSEFIMSFCEQILNGSLSAIEKSIIDRCVSILYSEMNGQTPTLLDFHALLNTQPETGAAALATAVELFAKGNLDMFAKETNVDMSNRLICFSMAGMRTQIKPVAMLVVLDAINNRVLLNKSKNITTWSYIDEFHLYFKYKYSADFLLSCWKQFRKLGAPLTGLTQNIEECVISDNARLMLSNSNFLLLLNQAAADRVILSELLKIPDAQMSYVTDAEPGCGLLKYGSALIPFKNEFPKDTELYRLMTTKPKDALDE
jgi:hypothetical protein